METVAPVKKSIFDSAILIAVERRWPSLSKTVNSSEITVDADKKRVHVSKDLFSNCKEMKKLFSYDAEIDDLLDRKCVPFYLKRAIYLLPIDLFSEVENALTTHAAGRQPLIDAIMGVYDQAMLDSKTALGALYNPADYLTAAEFKSRFKFSWQYLQIGVSDKLKAISAEIAAREEEKMKADWQEASAQIQQLLRVQFGELVSHACDRLTPAADGKKKVFRDSMITNITEFLSSFSARNLAQDTELQTFVEQMKLLTNGLTPEQLRDNEGLRNAIQKGFSEIKSNLDTLIEVAGPRKIRFED